MIEVKPGQFVVEVKPHTYFVARADSVHPKQVRTLRERWGGYTSTSRANIVFAGTEEQARAIATGYEAARRRHNDRVRSADREYEISTETQRARRNDARTESARQFQREVLALVDGK